MRFRLRRKPYHFRCPYCGGPFFTIHEVSMVGRRNRLPLLESMRGDIHCTGTGCGRMIPFEWFVNDRRGWHEKYRRDCIKWGGRPDPEYPWGLVDGASDD